LTGLGLSNCNRRQLYRYRDFYRAYPQIWGTLSPQLQHLLPERLTAPEKVGTPSPLFGLDGEVLLNRLSYSHLELLTELPEPLKRAFYEIECIKGGWSVRELERQIASLYFERSGLSRDKEKLSAMANAAAIQTEPGHIIRDPYVFEFLGLRPQEVLPESDLEAALIDKLHDFLLELGRGFQPIQFEEFKPCLDWWGKRQENEQAWKVPADELLAAGCNLDHKNPNAKEDITHLPPEKLADSISKKEQQIAEIMGTIKGLLAKGAS